MFQIYNELILKNTVYNTCINTLLQLTNIIILYLIAIYISLLIAVSTDVVA